MNFVFGEVTNLTIQMIHMGFLILGKDIKRGGKNELFPKIEFPKDLIF